MQFTPKTEAEIQAAECCPKGKYPFTVMEASEHDKDRNPLVSKTGKPMMRLKLNVHGPDGDYHVYDYVSPEFLAFKFRHFWHAIGLGADYDAGTTDARKALNREGWCDLDIKTDSYGTKNTIKDYVIKSVTATKPAAPVVQSPEDDVPF